MLEIHKRTTDLTFRSISDEYTRTICHMRRPVTSMRAVKDDTPLKVAIPLPSTAYFCSKNQYYKLS